MHIGQIASTTTHGTYTAEVNIVREFVEFYFGHGFSISSRDALALLTAEVTAIPDWFRGESELDMFIALGECGTSLTTMWNYFRDAANDENFADKIHAHKVDNCGMLCADYRCMAHRSASIYTEAYEMNDLFDSATNSVKHWQSVIERRRHLLTSAYRQIDACARTLAEIKGEHIPN